MATMTRGAVTLTALDVLGWSMTRTSRTVVHDIIGDSEPDVTARPPGLRTGTVRLLVSTEAEAEVIASALAVVGGPWSIDASVLTMDARVTGDITTTSLTDDGVMWAVDVGVYEVAP